MARRVTARPKPGPSVGSKIAEARWLARISQKGLAEALGVSRSLVGMMESGRRRVSVDTLTDIAGILSVPVASLLPESTVQPAPPSVRPAHGPERSNASA